jgi:peptide/nickel transport system substrate-binding protein
MASRRAAPPLADAPPASGPDPSRLIAAPTRGIGGRFCEEKLRFRREESAMHRQPLRLITVATVVAATPMLIGACAFSSKPKSGAGNTTLTIATEEDVRSPDNTQEEGTTTDKLMMGSTVYDPLFTTGKDGSLQPALATKATPSADLKTWTFTLRSGVKFTDGKAFTANDVKENFDAFQNPKSASAFSGDLKNVVSSNVVNDTTIDFHLKNPDTNFAAITQDTMFISDLDARKSKLLLAPGEVPIGTGPYKWSARQTGSSVTFARNDTYWRGTPPLSTVVFKVIPDGTAATTALQRGEVDMIANYVPPQSLPTLEKDPNIQMVTAQGGTFYQAYLNFEKGRKGGYKDPAAVRQGLADLVDTPDIVPKLIGDFGTLASQPVPTWQPGNDPSLLPYPYQHNVAAGEALLAQGGIPMGGKISMIALQDRPFLCQWATAVQSTLKQLGYNPDLQCIPSANAPKTFTQYKWDLMFYRTSGRPTASIMYQQRWGSALAQPPTDSYTLVDETLQGMINQMAAAADSAQYNALGAQVANRIIKTDVAVIPGYFDKVYFPVNKRVQGLQISPITWYGILDNAIGKVSVTDAKS